jgi:alpha-L-fucosidase 2
MVLIMAGLSFTIILSKSAWTSCEARSSDFFLHSMWGDAAPQDNYVYSTWWASAAPWMVFHQMEYFRFTGDKEYLRSIFPNLKAAAQFFVGFLSDYEGYKVVNPTMSPENAYYPPNANTTPIAITLGATMDTELLWELFNEIKEANELLELGEGSFVDQLDSLKADFPPFRENYFGGLQEWIHDYKEVSV